MNAAVAFFGSFFLRLSIEARVGEARLLVLAPVSALELAPPLLAKACVVPRAGEEETTEGKAVEGADVESCGAYCCALE